MHTFHCQHSYEDDCPESWTGTWEILHFNDRYCEMHITGRGSAFHVILGKCSSGYFLCIPSIDVGCALGSWSDTFWNTERISQILNETDAVTIATALYSCQNS